MKSFLLAVNSNIFWKTAHDLKNRKCPHCQYTTKRSYDLRRHIKGIHEKVTEIFYPNSNETVDPLTDEPAPASNQNSFRKIAPKPAGIHCLQKVFTPTKFKSLTFLWKLQVLGERVLILIQYVPGESGLRQKHAFILKKFTIFT